MTSHDPFIRAVKDAYSDTLKGSVHVNWDNTRTYRYYSYTSSLSEAGMKKRDVFCMAFEAGWNAAKEDK
jgi:hypothetical protein